MKSWRTATDEMLLASAARDRGVFAVFYERHERDVLGFFGAITRSVAQDDAEADAFVDDPLEPGAELPQLAYRPAHGPGRCAQRRCDAAA